jgi:hypothetical protein
MAKRKHATGAHGAGGTDVASGRTEAGSSGSAGKERLMDFAEDLGRLLGTAQRKADEWLGQRENLAKRLTDLRDTATDLLAKLQGGAAAGVRRGPKPGRPSSSSAVSLPSEPARRGRPPGSGKKKRTMSAAARAAISAAQKRRWARQKGTAKS